MVGFQLGATRVDLAENTVRVLKDDQAVWLTLDELRWLIVTSGPAALVQLEQRLAARGQTHMGIGTSPAPEA